MSLTGHFWLHRKYNDDEMREEIRVLSPRHKKSLRALGAKLGLCHATLRRYKVRAAETDNTSPYLSTRQKQLDHWNLLKSSIDKKIVKTMDGDEGNNTKIRHKESTYRKLYSSLLQRKKEELQLFSSSSSTAEKTSSSDSDFDDERNLLGQIVRTETRNLFFGVATTASIFALLRFGPTRSRILGGTKAKALQQAEIDGRRLGTAGVQQRIAIFIEGAFSMWAGFRAYDYTSQQSTSSYTTISQMPLCKGRSQISEVLCKEWIDITDNKIPNEFWKVHQSEDRLLRDDQTWTAIYQFALNCQKRHAFEQQIRRSSSQQKRSTPSQVNDYNDDNRPIILPTKVPENTVI